MRLRLPWPGLGSMLLLSACSFPVDSGSLATQYQQNPHPTQRYDLTLTITNAPSEFASVKSTMLDDVVNSQCLPPPSSNPQGKSNHMKRPAPFEMPRVSDTKYTGMGYTDFYWTRTITAEVPLIGSCWISGYM